MVPRGFHEINVIRFCDKGEDGVQVVSITHRPFLPPENNPVSRFCKSLCRLKGHSAIRRITSMKNSSHTSGIEAATFRFVAQHLNHCANAVPDFKIVS